MYQSLSSFLAIGWKGLLDLFTPDDEIKISNCLTQLSKTLLAIPRVFLHAKKARPTDQAFKEIMKNI